MKNANDNVFPDVYMCVCKDDGCIYTYNKYDKVDEETGKFRLVKSEIDLSNYVTLGSEQTITGKKKFSEITVKDKNPILSVNNTNADENGNVSVDVMPKGQINDENDDLDNYKTVGIWRVTDGVGHRPPNMDNNYGQLFVMNGDKSEWVTQIFSVEGDDNNDIWYRKWTGEAWGSWTLFCPSDHNHNGSYMSSLNLDSISNMAALKNYTNSSPAFCGSCNITDGPAGNIWYNVMWIPHRNGMGGGDNSYYGQLFMYPMTSNSVLFYRYQKNGNSWSVPYTYGHAQPVTGFWSGTTLKLYTHV